MGRATSALPSQLMCRWVSTQNPSQPRAGSERGLVKDGTELG